MPGKPNQVDLAQLFQLVASTMASNRENLNQADARNHDHGDNMVEIFNLVSRAIHDKQTAAPAEQLAHASQLLSQRKSGSAQVYAQGLSRASSEFQGQKFLTPENISMLIQTVMGATRQAPAAQQQPGLGDLLGSLMGAAQTPASDVGAQAGPGQAGLDVGDLLNAGRAFMDAKQRGGDNMQAIVSALSAGSAMSNASHRTQSGALVVNTLLQAISAMSAKK
jgi:hypothetical protein